MSRWTKQADALWCGGTPSKHMIAVIVRDAYISGLRLGYNDAVSDFFHAERPNGEVDEDWHVHTPTLKRRMAGFKRWGM